MKKVTLFVLMLWHGAVWSAASQSVERDIPAGTTMGTVEQLDLTTGIVTIDGTPMALAPSAEREIRNFIGERGSPLGKQAIYELKDGSGSQIVEHLFPMDEREMGN